MKFTNIELSYLNDLLSKERKDIQLDLDGGADRYQCEQDMLAIDSIIEKINQ